MSKVYGVILLTIIVIDAKSNSSIRSLYRQECGIDKSPIKVVYEGFGTVETYPWIGTLFYRNGGEVLSTAVVLVTKQMAIGNAADIDKVPKIDFRIRARVVFGTTCNGIPYRIKNYSYHPDYTKTTFSAPVLIQLESNLKLLRLRPICSPPAALNNVEFYAMTTPNDCNSSTITIHKMKYVKLEDCKEYYIKHELNVESIWPSQVICARASSHKDCIWRSGTILTLRQNEKWSLVGFGITGPGCRAPARFMDYSLNQPWVRNSILRIGRPTITRLSDHELVLRRSLSSIQRYGPCDPEETNIEMFTDHTVIEKAPTSNLQKANYNFTIFENLDYSCVVFKVFYVSPVKRVQPKIYLKRYCMSPTPLCYAMHFLQIDFYIEIFFKDSVSYQVSVYGREVRVIDMKRVMNYFNNKKKKPVVVTRNFYDDHHHHG